MVPQSQQQAQQEWTSTGGDAVRCGLPEHDLSRPAVVNMLVKQIRPKLMQHHNVRVHAAFPCTPWTSLQRLIVKIDPKKITHLEADRRKSTRMISLFLRSMRRLRKEFG
eukprot:5662149-Pyramimonas_sp.AAC.1